MSNIGFSDLGFIVTNNVNVRVIDTNTNEIVKSVSKHNKAKRNLVIGMLRFLLGHFNPSNRQGDTSKIYNISDAKNYIPCYIGVGDGGVVRKEGTIKPTFISGRIPELKDWSDNVSYSNSKLVRELDTFSRCEIGKISDSTGEVSSGDIDSIYISAALPPGFCNVDGITTMCITEIGLFADPIIGSTNILASVQLDNKYSNGVPVSTDTLYVRPQDTVTIDWTISIIALGCDSIHHNEDKDIEVDSYVGSATIELVD